MRPRTIILILAGVLFLNLLTILGVWVWSKVKTARVQTFDVQSETNLAEAANFAVEPAPADNSSPEIARSTLSVPDVSATWVEFDAPRDGEAVPRRFPVTGRCGPVPAGSQLMLVVDAGRGVFSPKLPAIVVDKETWSGMGNEFGAPSGGTFSLCVFAVSDEAVGKITEWHAQGKATGKWPPFRGSVPGGAPLAKIKLRVANK
ncbi:MAG TPA: hypothetical protein VGF13_17565 [Verrucomicrobiae bacterium]